MKSTIYQHHLRASASFSYRHRLGSSGTRRRPRCQATAWSMNFG